jgi:mono/diheme cytochrome c family protein
MKKYVVSAVVIIVVLLSAPFAVMKTGVINVSADAPPPAWEASLMPMALRASVKRHAPVQANPVTPTDANLAGGAEIYNQMCASCHGRTNGKPGILGASLYPPAPQLSGHPTAYSEAELFWIVKHGIRNTGMPGWGRQLSDDDLWHLAALLKRFDQFPAAAKGEPALR